MSVSCFQNTYDKTQTLFNNYTISWKIEGSYFVVSLEFPTSCRRMDFYRFASRLIGMAGSGYRRANFWFDAGRGYDGRLCCK